MPSTTNNFFANCVDQNAKLIDNILQCYKTQHNIIKVGNMKHKEHKNFFETSNRSVVFARQYDTGICADENWESRLVVVAHCVIQSRPIRRN